MVMGALIQWIGLRENFQESPKRIGTSMVSGEDVPLNQSIDLLVADFQI
jgi:hypothetical protein